MNCVMDQVKENKKGIKKADVVLFIIISLLSALLILGVKAIWV